MVLVTNLPPPTEGRFVKEPETHAFVGDRVLGVGSLYVGENCVSWIGDEGNGFSLEYPAIVLHAVSRDLNNFPQECLYLMIDVDACGAKHVEYGCELSKRLNAVCNLQLGQTQSPSTAAAAAGQPLPLASTPMMTPAQLQNQTLNESFVRSQNREPIGSGEQTAGGREMEPGYGEPDDEEQEAAFTEIRFVPRNKNSLDPLFAVLSEFQALHPNESDSFSDDEDEDEDEALDEDELLSASMNQVQFDEDGQVLLDHQMRGVVGAEPPVPYRVDGTQTHSNGVDSYAMETGQFDDPIETDDV